MKNLIKRKIDCGFTLIEVLIAIFLIGVAFVGVVAFFNSSLKSHLEAKNELVAAGLAQEGSELIRNLRDYKVLHDSATWSDLADGTSGLSACTRIDYDSLASHLCDNSKSDNVCLNGEERYEQCSGGETGVGFKRTISVRCEDENNDEVSCGILANVKSLRVVSSVTWNGRETEATDRLYENEF
ncbi:MAG: prepilin-type N-terminal cleavage/methylation domain-containing protein [Parcubacteria group bacterium]|jgi:prepilin-type N-terminal cleavage/methylation domain-containing protein